MLSEADVNSVVQSALAPYGAQLQDQAWRFTEPLVDKTIEAMKPAVREEIRFHLPTAIAVTAGALGAAYLVGTALTARTIERMFFGERK